MTLLWKTSAFAFLLMILAKTQAWTLTKSVSPRSRPLFQSAPANVVDPNVYNVDVEKAADLWNVVVSDDTRIDRQANKPFLETKAPQDYYVDDIEVQVSRAGGMGLELIELAGGRDDGYGLTIVSSVSGNAEAAGVIPGDSIAGIEIRTSTGTLNVAESTQSIECECRDFDTTMAHLISLETEKVTLQLKRVRRWPKIECSVEYPPVQCADGADPVQKITLTAGENLQRALMNRGVVFEDRDAPKCDFCGTKCSVRVVSGMHLLSPAGTTEKKIMRKNPTCRISCRTTVGHNLQEGSLSLKVNLNEWKN